MAAVLAARRARAGPISGGGAGDARAGDPELARFVRRRGGRFRGAGACRLDTVNALDPVPAANPPDHHARARADAGAASPADARRAGVPARPATAAASARGPGRAPP